MKPDFSEFSFGYAFTEELVTKHKAALIGAPLFPSLYKEGKAGGGYDVHIPVVGKPVFLQFKLCDHLERKSAKEFRRRLLPVPYYRMHLRPTNHSDQHNLLLALEASGETVLYVAPEFHQPAELNAFYLSRSVIPQSAAFSPSSIGALDDGEHYVVFEKGATSGFLCSDEARSVPKLNLHEGLSLLISQLGAQERKLGVDGLRDIASRMIDVLASRDAPAASDGGWTSESPGTSRPTRLDVDGLRRIVALRRRPMRSMRWSSRSSVWLSIHRSVRWPTSPRANCRRCSCAAVSS